MVTTCFVFQNLVTQYLEGSLPSVRHHEVSLHLKKCQACSELQSDMSVILEILNSFPKTVVSHELSLQALEAAQSPRARWTRRRLSLAILSTSIILVMAVGMVVLFPESLARLGLWRGPSDSDRWVRYYPLLQGASDIVEEQSGWLQFREPFARSLWEEGGLSPEEFEKTFSPRVPGSITTPQTPESNGKDDRP